MMSAINKHCVSSCLSLHLMCHSMQIHSGAISAQPACVPLVVGNGFKQ